MSCIKPISVEPVLFSAALSIYLYAIISNQYIYYRIAKDYGVHVNASGDSCNSPGTNGTTNHSEILEKISAESSEWIMYTNIAGIQTFILKKYLL